MECHVMFTRHKRTDRGPLMISLLADLKHHMARSHTFEKLKIYDFLSSLDKHTGLFDPTAPAWSIWDSSNFPRASCWLNIWILMFSPLMTTAGRGKSCLLAYSAQLGGRLHFNLAVTFGHYLFILICNTLSSRNSCKLRGLLILIKVVNIKKFHLKPLPSTSYEEKAPVG